MYFSASAAWAVVRRDLSLRGIAALREAHPDRPSWTALFTKAFALVAAEFPELRRVYMRWPWPHLYEYPLSVANVAVERRYGEEIGLGVVQIKNPPALPLAHIGWLIKEGKSEAFAKTKAFRRMVFVASLPLLLRRLLWWVGLNISRYRANHFGTYGISTMAPLGADGALTRAPVTTIVTYGVVNHDGAVAVRAIFDHRVLDGMTMARVLWRLEEIIKGEIADELRAQSPEFVRKV